MFNKFGLMVDSGMDINLNPVNGEVPDGENWTNSLVISFINDQLNYWRWYYPIEEYRVEFVNHWKCCIWLEQVGFSFWGNDYRGRICDFFEEAGFASVLHPESVSVRSNNLLIFRMRNLCREILNFHPLEDSDFTSSMTIELIDWRVSADLPGGAPSLDSAPYSDETIEREARNPVEIIKSQYRDRLEIWHLAYKKSLTGSKDEFTDNITGSGYIPLVHCGVSERIIFGELILNIAIKQFNLDFQDCKLPTVKGKYIEALRRHLISSIER